MDESVELLAQYQALVAERNAMKKELWMRAFDSAGSLPTFRFRG